MATAAVRVYSLRAFCRVHSRLHGRRMASHSLAPLLARTSSPPHFLRKSTLAHMRLVHSTPLHLHGEAGDAQPSSRGGS